LPARFDHRVLDGEHRKREAAYADARGRLVAGLDGRLRVGGDAGAPAQGAEARDGLGVVLRHVLAPVEAYEVLARGDDRGPLRDGEDRGALRGEGRGDGLVKPL